MNVSALGNTASARGSGKQYELKSEDFIKMMLTQLQNQDPLEPAKNEQLLTQMSQIGQLQASTQLQSSLKDLVLQNNLSSAGSMIGKLVEGVDEVGDQLTGLVTSVRVENGQIFLEMDNGKRMPMTGIRNIASGNAN